MDLLSICIPFHAGLTRLERCLASLQRCPANCGQEVLVIDDASSTPCASRVQYMFPGTGVIRLDENVGFAAAVNRGVERASGEYILILNSDTEVQAGALDSLVDCLRSEPDVGAAGPLLLNEDGTVQPQCKRGRLTPLTGLSYALGVDKLFPGHALLDGYMRRTEGYVIRRDVLGLMGSCMLLRKEALTAVGSLDETMFLYGEDLDLCYRLSAAGWRVRFCPDARVIHVGGAGGTQVRQLRSLFHYHRSLRLLFRKHPPSSWYPLYAGLVAAGLWTRFGLMVIAHGLGRERVGSRRARGPVAPAREGPP